MSDFDHTPTSRFEEIMRAIIDGTEVPTREPRSVMEALLLELNNLIKSIGGGIKVIGVTTTPLTDGSSTNPIMINGESYTAKNGDMVAYSAKEFLFNNESVWQELGDVYEVMAIIDDILANLAPNFSSSVSYDVGAYVIQNNHFYKCTTAHSGAWAAADFTQVSIASELMALKNDISAIKDGSVIDSFADVESALADKTDNDDVVASAFSVAETYAAGDYCTYEGGLYKFKSAHTGAWDVADVDRIKIAGELSELKNTIKNGIVYGFHIDGSVSDPSNRVTYLRDAIGKTPAYMDYNEGSFNYGSWEDAFFMPRPCMVERSGNVAYYLDPNDYTKKTDGTASDIADTAYAGNAMMEWGRDGKKIWMKIEPDSGDANSCNVYIADHRVDATYHDWSFHNCNGVSVDHFYTPIYNGSAVSDGTNNVLRSLSGQYISHTQNASTEITMAGRNNAGSAEIWGTEVYADIVLINMLLTLIGKSTNSQAVFGRGLDSGSETAMKAYVTGALNDKGLFFGYNDGDHGVKVFGMENWWACQWRRYRGHIMVDGAQKVKLTYGTEDGSTAAGYNLTGDNYISVGATPTGTSGQYCDKYEFSPNGAFPKDADNTKATASTHYCDGLWFNNSGTRVPFRGGDSDWGSPDGAWSVGLHVGASYAGWIIGAALSCKPLA